MAQQISKNDKYVMHMVSAMDSDFSFLKKNTLKTLFLHDGNIKLDLHLRSGKRTIVLEKDQGIILAPNIEFAILENSSEMFAVQSEQDNNPIIEIVDQDNERSEQHLIEFRKIENPKKVIKPWGHEIWISWFKHHHVLKRIFMVEGNKCSLQYHEKKSETNIIVSGKANVLKDIHLQNGISEDDALLEFNKVEDINSYITKMGANDFWDNSPFEVHRVFSTDSYTAYEASTAELDDVIRLQDDSNRVSGFIKAEHNY